MLGPRRPLGAAGLTYILPITTAIVVLLGIVYVSYRQTIGAYPSGGAAPTPWHAKTSGRLLVCSPPLRS